MNVEFKWRNFIGDNDRLNWFELVRANDNYNRTK